MKYIHTFILFVLSATLLLAQTTETREIGGFTAISCSGIAKVIITQSETYSVEVETSEDNMKDISTTLNGNTLLIKTTGNWKNKSPKIYVKTPTLESITANGTSEVYSTGLIKSDNFSINTTGATELTLSLKTTTLKINATGASEIELKGYAEELNITSTGASEVDADQLISSNAKVDLSGASSVDINASESVSGVTNGASSLQVEGHPKTKSVSRNGVSSISIDNDYSYNIDEYNEEVEIKNDIIGDVLVQEHGDTTRISIGNKKLLIIEDLDKTKVDLSLKDSSKSNSDSWTYGIDGLIIGANGFLNSSNNMDLPEEYEYLETDIARSRNVHLNLLDGDFKLFDKYVTLHPGVGFEFNSYEFRKNYWIHESSDKNEEIGASQAFNNDSTDLIKFDKNRLKDTYLNIPVMLAFHTHRDHKKALHLGVGGYAGLRLASKVKYKYRLDGEGRKLKAKDDYYLSPFRYGLMASIGYSNINIFANYSLNGLFEDKKGPELHPFSIGIMIVQL